ncbi:DUF2268 domain-containing protein [Lacihabitans soyangensis]|uniref:DUF2268 domain-containing protein n=1 Tax=Lacihabitans soyangensis TaxID=869394 RepID=A0AAE3H358_9BACT|nr:DUF2268 domain-containing protein [Lacihabitans soyangensis]MCP9764137.1 hypothetical protein [Lacihabitans soyangensis]MCP9764254.1 hypothetical protein [Lacihabitans soyangensis]
MKKAILIISLFLLSQLTQAQNLITTDLENFGEMYGQLPTAKTTEDTLNLIRANLLAKGSATFKEYIQLKESLNNYKIEEEFLNKLRLYPKYYASVLRQSEVFKSKEIIQRINAAYGKLLKIYPEAKIKPNVICIGIMDDGGKSFESGQYVGLELFTCNSFADTTEVVETTGLIDYLKAGSFDINRMDELIVHELVHLSQFKGNDEFLKTFKGTIQYIPLLGEGGAAFIADLVFDFKATIGPGTFNAIQYKYCEENKDRLWQDYKNLTDMSKISDYFYKNTDLYPVRSVGYYLGYQVCKQYYEKAKNKKQAIKDIIEVTDYDGLVRKSGF